MLVAAQAGPPALAGGLRLMAGPIVQDVTDHSAIIFWLTSRGAAMTLKYGLNQRQLDQIGVSDPAGQSQRARDQEHRIGLRNLRPAQNYFFEVLDQEGKRRASGQFQTEPSEYAQASRLKIIDGPVFEYLADTSAQIAWTTNSQSSTLIRYGTDPNDLRRTAQALWGEQTHRVEITALEPNTKYYFVVESSAGRDTGTMAKSAEGSFQTERPGEPALINIEPRR